MNRLERELLVTLKGLCNRSNNHTVEVRPLIHTTGERIAFSLPAFQSAMQTLREKGFITRTISPNRQESYIKLTPEGRKAITDISIIRDRNDAKASVRSTVTQHEPISTQEQEKVSNVSKTASNSNPFANIAAKVNPFAKTRSEAATQKFDRVNREIDTKEEQDMDDKRYIANRGRFRALHTNRMKSVRKGKYTEQQAWEMLLKTAAENPEYYAVDETLAPDYQSDVREHGEYVRKVGEAAASRPRGGVFPPRNDVARPMVAAAQKAPSVTVDSELDKLNTRITNVEERMSNLETQTASFIEATASAIERISNAGTVSTASAPSAPAPAPAASKASTGSNRKAKTVDELSEADIAGINEWFDTLVAADKRNYVAAILTAFYEGNEMPDPVEFGIDPTHAYYTKTWKKLNTWGIYDSAVRS